VWLDSDERGSAVSDFVLVSLPLLTIFVTTISITFASFMKTVVIDATMEGVRFAALADQDIPQGIQRTKYLIQKTIGNSLEVEVSGSAVQSGQSQLIHFTSSVELPIGFLGPIIEYSAYATKEARLP
jgi:hypothetical protein